MKKPNFLLDNIIFYLSIFIPLIIYIFLTNYYFNNFVNPLDSVLDYIMFFLKLFWFGGIILVPTSFIAWFLYGSPLKQDYNNVKVFESEGWDQSKKLVVVFVARGQNIDALGRSIFNTLTLLNRYSIHFEIEVVTDVAVETVIRNNYSTIGSKVFFYQVPDHYETENIAKYKARALHYLVDSRERSLLDNTWYLHFDEESQITVECIAGLHKFFKTKESHSVVAQGEIKYNAHNYGKNLMITAIDAIRTGDDLGRFRFQLKLLGVPVFGIHGSFILIPAKLEHRIGFDLGGKGSITEDAYFALTAAEMGYKFRWIDGFIREQSPFSLTDIIKQRRRWISGLVLLANDNQLKLKTRLPLKINLFLWQISWISIFVTIVNILIGGSWFPTELAYAAAVITGGFYSMYTVGSYRNLRDLDISLLKKLGIYFATLLLIPLSAIIEGIAVIYATLEPVEHFEVVEKN
jgi:beta-1,4-mannosyltransferase